MEKSTLKSDFILLTASIIWGLSFVAQRLGMEHIGPFLFTAIRFFLGTLVLLPLWKTSKSRQQISNKKMVLYGIAAGCVLFIGISFQQVGIIYTTAGKAGFITGLYVVLVPILGIVIRLKTHWNTWTGAALAVLGLYFLSITKDFTIEIGDLLVVISAVFWAVHVHLVGKLSPKMDAVKLSVIQFLTCGIISAIVAIATEEIDFNAVYDTALPLLYGGVLSVGVGFTLQVVGQKHAPPAHAAIILSLEGVFAVIGGMLLLSENLSSRGWVGCALMFTGMMISQLFRHRTRDE
jgi:drug/metabolite transporter (DMT)-like permease